MTTFNYWNVRTRSAFCERWFASCNWWANISRFDTPNREHTLLMTVLGVSCGYVRLCRDIHICKAFRYCLIVVWQYCESVCVCVCVWVCVCVCLRVFACAPVRVMFFVRVLILYKPLADLNPITEFGPTWWRRIDWTFRSWRAWKVWEYLLCIYGNLERITAYRDTGAGL